MPSMLLALWNMRCLSMSYQNVVANGTTEEKD